MLTYAGIPSQISAPVISVTSGNLTTPVTGSLYWQMRNRQGFNLYSAPTTINLIASQGLSVTVPDCNCEGYEAISYILSFSPTNTYLAAYVIATYSAFDTLPGTITLDKDDYFVTQLSVGNTSQLPTNKINGMRAYVDAWGEIREWNNGQWVSSVYPQEFQTLITSTTSTNGCDRLLSEFTEDQKQIIIRPDYAVDRSYSEPVKFWLRNETTSSFYAGRSIIVGVFWGTTDLTDLFFAAGAVNLTFLGYANLSDGTIDTSASSGGQMTGINQRITYTNNNSGLILEKDLPSGYAYLVAVEIQVDIASLGGRVTESSIAISLSIGERIGYYSGVAAIIGNLISADYDKRRIVPDTGLSAIALSGSGIVNGRSFIGAGERTVFGLTANTSDQIVGINGNGTCLVVSELVAGQALRAKIGTLDGIGKPVFAGNIALSNATQLQINLTHPTAIRSDYPDVIAGNSKGKFNASSIRVWVGDTLYIVSLVPDELSQTITLTGSGGSTSPVTSSELGLYKPSVDSIAPISGSSSFATGTYPVYAAYYYVNTVTTIFHQGIVEMESDILTYIESSAIKYALVFG